MDITKMMDGIGAFLVSFGYFGAGLASVCAVVAMLALTRNAAGVVGGAVGVWVVGAMISATAIFSDEWRPLGFSGIVIVAGLVLGALVRAVFPPQRGLRMSRDRGAHAISETPAQPRSEIKAIEGAAPVTA